MKKRILSLMLVLSMVFAVAVFATGCGEDPIEVFKKATENMGSEALSTDGKASLEVDMGGAKTTVEANFGIAYIAAEEDEKENPYGQMKASFDMNLLGETMEGSMYLKGEKMYMDIDGEKVAASISEETSKELLEGIKNAGEVEGVPVDEYIKKAEMKGDDIHLEIDGKGYMKAVMSSDEFKDATNDQEISEYQSQVESMMGDIIIDATVKNEKFTKMKITMDLKVDMGTLSGTEDLAGPGGDYDMKLVVELNNIKEGKDVKINWPNFDEFTTVDYKMY